MMKEIKKTRKFGNKNLKAAEKEWCEDSGKAEAMYGHILGWDTSEVTSTSCLFYDKEKFNDDISKTCRGLSARIKISILMCQDGT